MISVTYPMINPAIKPKMMHENTSNVVLLNLFPVLSMKIKSPNAKADIIQIKGMSKTVE